MQGRLTVCLHSDAGKGWMAHNSGTRICFWSRFSRLLFFVSSEEEGRETPLRLTYL